VIFTLILKVIVLRKKFHIQGTPCELLFHFLAVWLIEAQGNGFWLTLDEDVNFCVILSVLDG